ncbi:biotin--[acetyl-CoA-carboxylase] ligase [Chryseomicrobium excrementi]|uniref:Bifunctional ligase/repressor BirA n=1 Tax=Chryseomicrobium excrementi TaxID=2041346 RepID=A0A2M9F2Q7_9BACL|nr:biotin--[acetyl-CoA-carboxylase] ligase [Chryseomicrobium excrementi]PJK17751.1 biotin--[acetyl-CoA-carboxylase] ligase [Chryseomicrobium excrementi]
MSNKAKIVTILKQATEPVSGEQLAETVGVSRTMIWKYIQSLIEEGYRIEAVKKKGYVLQEMSSKISQHALESYLKTNTFARNLHTLDSCSSTQKVANELILNGQAPHGLLVVSDLQTEGKGRLNRPWASTEGKGLWTTWVVRPDLLPHEAPPITLVVALALAVAIERVTSVKVDIKWPNDLLIDGYKTAGILTELQATPDKIEAILIGIGINVLQTAEDFADPLTARATSLQLACDHPINRTELLAEIALELEKAIEKYELQGFRPFMSEWEKRSSMIGEKVTATTVRETIQGIALGINEHGALLVDTGEGVRALFSGDVTLSGKLDR